jgi:Signal transduction histidine kinase
MEVNLNDHALADDSVLAASERTAGFSYTAPELTHPERVRYEVRLTPRDDQWRTTQRDFTRYTDLDPGTYRFEVRARLGDAPPGSTATYSFTIPPFFYEMWWFQLLVGLGLIGLGIGAWRWRTYRLRRRQKKLEAAVETQTEELRERTEELAKEKQKTEEQAERLAELDEAKNRFFAHISHEFRTPLSLILTPLEEALRNATTETIDFGTEQVKRMVRNARRLQRLIEQLLDLATLEAGRMKLDRRLGDLMRVVRRTAEAFSSMAEQKDVDLQVRTAGPALKARFDPDKVESIVSNLLSNALKFTPSGGQVIVWIGERTTPRSAGDGAAREAILKVSDTGPGMDAETQARIFERFEHVDAADTREHEGAGLGLALTKELVDLHDGTIEVESSPGEGTTFTVALPLVPAEEATRGEEASGDGAWTHGDMEARGNGERGDERRVGSLSERERVGETGAAEANGESGEEAGEGTATVLVVEDNAEMRAYLREQLSTHWQVQ